MYYNIPRYYQELYFFGTKLDNNCNVLGLMDENNHQTDTIVELFLKINESITFIVSTNLSDDKTTYTFYYHHTIKTIKDALISDFIPTYIQEDHHKLNYVKSRLHLSFINTFKDGISNAFKPDTNMDLYDKSIGYFYCVDGYENCLKDNQIEIRMVFYVSIVLFEYDTDSDHVIQYHGGTTNDVLANEKAILEMIQAQLTQNNVKVYVNKYILSVDYPTDNSFREIPININDERKWSDLMNVLDDQVFFVFSKTEISSQDILTENNIDIIAYQLGIQILQARLFIK